MEQSIPEHRISVIKLKIIPSRFNHISFDIASYLLHFFYVQIQLQWNPSRSNADTLGTHSECPDYRGVLISGVVLYT